MIEVRGIESGVVIDHITAGKGLAIFNRLHLDELLCPVVLLMGVGSEKLGTKDIIKIEGDFNLDMNALGLIDSGVTVNVIEKEKLIKKNSVDIPAKVQGLFRCSNPRCISNFDEKAIPTFKLRKSNGELEYQCDYCEDITTLKA